VQLAAHQHYGTIETVIIAAVDPNSEVYQLNLASSGKLKLRAKALWADGGDHATFEACRLLHEAARLEQLAVNALPTCPPATRLAASVEECWCLVEGRDPPQAGQVWGRVLRDRRDVDEETAKAMLVRLTPRYQRTQSDFARLVAASPSMLMLSHLRKVAALSAGERARAQKEVARILREFPGCSSFWWMNYRLAEAAGNKAKAWDSIAKARHLAPDNSHFEAMSLLVAAWALPVRDADRYLDSARPRLDRTGSTVCLMYALAELNLARKGSEELRKMRWDHAQYAANAGLAQATSEGERVNLKAVQLILQELLAGREPTLDILYLAGLGAEAAMAKPQASVVDLVIDRVRQAA
jgi:hypothetical protein